MKTLVTGATGFIGSRLMRAGATRGLVRRPVGRVGEVVGNLLDPASLSLALEGIETVFHCAGLSDADQHNETLHWEVNVQGTENLLACAHAAGVKRVVFFSSVMAMGAPGDCCVDERWPVLPTTVYGRAKRAAEERVIEAACRTGLQTVVLRLAPVYGRGGQGNIARLARLVQRGFLPALPETGNRRSIVHVDDVVAAAHRAAAAPLEPGEVFIVAHPEPLSTAELYDRIRQVLELGRPRWRLPAQGLSLLGALHPRLRAHVDRLSASACYDPGKIERQLGFRARIGIEAGLREMLS